MHLDHEQGVRLHRIDSCKVRTENRMQIPVLLAGVGFWWQTAEGSRP